MQKRLIKVDGTASGIVPRALQFIPILAFLLMAAAGAMGREFPPSIPPPSPVVLPTPAIHTLSNGLKVLVIERRSLPMVTLRLTVKSGAAADPAELPGLAEMVAALLSQGTSRQSAQEISETIDQMGGTIESAAEWDDSFASMTVLSDHTELGFDILADMVIHPTFPAEELDRRRKQTISALEVLRDDPSDVADRVFDLLVFAGTPYGHSLDGTLQSLRRMAPGDLKAFQEAHYRPGNSVLSIVGDISEDEGMKLSRKFFGDWEKGQGKEEASTRPAGEMNGGVLIVDKPDAVQTEIRVGTQGIPRTSPDYEALTVANQVLGGAATNRLFKTLRSQEGLAYAASSDLVCNRSFGSWEVKTSTRTSGTAKALETILEQVKGLRERPISGAELNMAQSYLLGHMALEFETPESLSDHLVDLMVHGLPLDTWNRFGERIEQLSTEEVFGATRGALGARENIIVLVGNASGFRSDLKKLGPLKIIPLSDLDFGALSRDAVKGPNPND
jgi:zinc protease